jgi:hypothetical protein
MLCHLVKLSKAKDKSMPLLDIVEQALALSVEGLQR